MSKVLIINGSPRAGGNSAIAVREMETVFRENGVEVTTVQIGGKAIRGCIGCGKCQKTCSFDAITLQNNLAYIDADKCRLCRKCVEECPTGAILQVNFPARPCPAAALRSARRPCRLAHCTGHKHPRCRRLYFPAPMSMLLPCPGCALCTVLSKSLPAG